MKIKEFLRTFWGGVTVVIIIVALGYLVWSVLSNKGVSFDILGPEEVKAGNIYDYHLVYANNSRIVLVGAELELRLPPGVILLSEPEKRVVNYFLGEVDPRSQGEKAIKLLFAGTPSATQEIQAVFRYRPKSLSSTFEISKRKTILISGSSFNLNLRFPNKVFIDQEFPLEVDWANQSSNYFDNVEIRVDWPEGYTFRNSEPAVSSEAKHWRLGYLTPQSSGVITIRGFASGNEGETKKMRAYIGINQNGVFLPLTQAEALFTLIKNPLEVQVTVNNSTDVSAHLGDWLNFNVLIINRYPSSLRNLKVKVVFTDNDILDFTTLRAPRALFSARLKTLLWDGAKIDNLYVLPSREKTNLSFSVRLKKNWPFISQAQENSLIEVQTEVTSSNIPEGVELTELPKSVSVNTIKLGTDVRLGITSFFRDAPSGIANQGRLPLRVGEPTDFTIHWKIYNTFNKLRNVEIKTTLPPEVEFTSQIGGNYGDNPPLYNKETKEFVWKLDSVPAGSGILRKPVELIFQVRITPSITQINQAAKLIEETSLTAVDSFTNQEIHLTYPPVLSTQLTDKTVNTGEGIVRE